MRSREQELLKRALKAERKLERIHRRRLQMKIERERSRVAYLLAESLLYIIEKNGK
jgi:hypothetical protein